MKIFNIDPNFIWMVKINSLMVNNIQADKLNKDDKAKVDQDKNVMRKIIISHTLGAVVMIAVYGLIFGLINFKKIPIMYDIVVLIFLVSGILQSIVFFHNVLFESKDYDIYKTLPIKESHIVGAKITSVALAISAMTSPILVVSISRAIRYGMGPMSIIGLFDFIVAYIFTIVLGLAISTFIGGLHIRKKWRNLFMNLVNILNVVVNIGMILSVQYVFKDSIVKSISKDGIVYGPISWIMVSDLNHVIMLVVITVLNLVSYRILIGKVIESIKNYNLISRANDKKVRREKTKNVGVGTNIDEKYSIRKRPSSNEKPVSILWILVIDNISKLGDSTILMQNLFSCLVPLIIMSTSFKSVASEFIFPSGDLRYNLVFGIMLSVGIGLVASTIPSNMFSIIVSLDREDYDYIKVLPLSRSKYFASKFLAGAIVQLPLVALIFALVEWYIGIRPVVIFVAVINLILMTIPIYLSWMLFDIEHRSDKWQNITELNSRIGGVSVFMIMILVFMAFFGIVALTNAFYKYISYMILFLVWLAIMFLVYGFLFIRYKGVKKRMGK